VPCLVVFDLDGTLVDSLADLTSAANALVEDLGGRPLDAREVSHMVGEGARVLVERVLRAAGLDAPTSEALPRFLARYDERLLDRTRPYPGIPTLLDALAPAVSMSVLTNKPGAATARILEGLGLARYFRCVVSGDGPYPRKPAPDGLLALASDAACAPGEALLVGDSPVDVRTARAAGTGLCLARYGFGFRDVRAADIDGTEWIVDAPGEIAERLQRAFNRGASGGL
jgi:phosphoglycolate phosphatase